MKYAEGVVDVILTRIDHAIAAYVEASAAELDEAGLAPAARMVNSSALVSSRTRAGRVPSSGEAAPGRPLSRPQGILPYVLLFLVGSYAWQLHGWLVALGVVIGQFGVVMALNNLLFRRWTAKESSLETLLRHFRLVHWILFAVFMVGLGLSGVQTFKVDVPPSRQSDRGGGGLTAADHRDAGR